MAAAPPRGMAGRRPQAGRQMMSSPAAFNRLARLQRQRCGAIPFATNVAGRFLELPNVGFHYRVFAQFDLDLGTTAAVSGRFKSGGFGDFTNRFVCPTGILRSLRYTLNVSSPIYATDGYGNYVLQLIANRGVDPFQQVATTTKDRNRKERATFAIFNATTGALIVPDALVVTATNYKLRGVYLISLTLGESASAGLIPVQDIRITPQIFMDMGDQTDIVSVGGDIPSITGNFNIFCDYFTVPNENIRPDTEYVMQTRQDIVSVAGQGEQIYRPQIGGIILRCAMTVWNNSQAIDTVTADGTRLRIQQGIQLEQLTQPIRTMDERRWYSKFLPDELYVYDHIAGFGDPTLPSLRDRIASNQLTRLEYIFDWNTGAASAVLATAELRNYLQQLIPLPRV